MSLKFSHKALFTALLGLSIPLFGCQQQLTPNTPEFKQAEFEYFDAEQLIYRGSYDKALPILKALGEQGFVDAQNTLGAMYQRGEGVKQDDTQAFKWYEKAAKQGLAHAQFKLGEMYQNGQGVKQNDSRASEWYQKATEQGSTQAQFNLGTMYNHGKGVQQNKKKARQYFGITCVKGSQDGCEEYRKLKEQGY